MAERHVKKDDTLGRVCGIIMPISSIDGCSEGHWKDVLGIINDAVKDAGFEPNLVSNADEVGAIHKRIVQNLYDNPIVVCDVSGKNPNVMFELGMRLAFDKPAIIVKDDRTSYSFDTSSIEHLEYPRDLRFTNIVDFKERLKEKIIATYERSVDDPSYTTFLKHFGEFTVARLDKKEIPAQDYIIEELKNLRSAVMEIRAAEKPFSYAPSSKADRPRYVCFGRASDSIVDKAVDEFKKRFPEMVVARDGANSGHIHIFYGSDEDSAVDLKMARMLLEKYATPARRDLISGRTNKQ